MAGHRRTVMLTGILGLVHRKKRMRMTISACAPQLVFSRLMKTKSKYAFKAKKSHVTKTSIKIFVDDHGQLRWRAERRGKVMAHSARSYPKITKIEPAIHGIFSGASYEILYQMDNGKFLSFEQLEQLELEQQHVSANQ
jgi:hypothetical protein